MVRSSAALHEQVRATLAQEIADGVYDETGKIPAEPELCERFGVSRITVRRAVSDLEAMGTVRRRQGTGTFVTKRDNAISVMTIGGFADTYASRTDHMTRQVKRAEVTTADAQTAAALHVEPGAPVFALERVFLLDGVPISIDRSTYSLDRFPDLDKRVDAETSTYRVLREEYGVEFAEVRRDVRIGFTTPESAEWLQRPANEPLLVTDKVALDRAGQVIHTSRIEYPPSRVALRTVAYADHPPEQPQT